MSNSITLSQSAYKELLSRINHLEKMVASLMKKFEQEPPYGTDAWWDWSIKKSEEDIKKGDYYELRDKKELDSFFKNIEHDRPNEQFRHKVRSQG